MGEAGGHCARFETSAIFRQAALSAPVQHHPFSSRSTFGQGSTVSIQFTIAVTHLVSRKRPTLVSLVGIALGVAFFLAVSSLMRGSERDFIKRLVDNSPHLTVYDEYQIGRAHV